MRVGNGTLRFELVPDWERPPSHLDHPDVAGVAVSSSGDVYLFCRTDCPVHVYDRSGTFLAAWGEGEFTRPKGPHGIFIDADDFVYLVDETGHVVRKYTADGRAVMELGSGQPSDTGHTGGKAAENILHAAGPFNRPTNVTTHPNGCLYAADGYGNARIHRFEADGNLLQSWGEPGSGAGQFVVPHGIWVHEDGRVFVADRENDRIQIFSPTGEHLGEWLDVQRPCDIFIDAAGLVFVAELCRFAGDVTPHGVVEHDLPARVSVLDGDGNVLLRWGGPDTAAPGNFVAPHSLWVDDEGSIYVAEVTETMGVRPGRVPSGTHTLQKFARY